MPSSGVSSRLRDRTYISYVHLHCRQVLCAPPYIPVEQSHTLSPEVRAGSSAFQQKHQSGAVNRESRRGFCVHVCVPWLSWVFGT